MDESAKDSVAQFIKYNYHMNTIVLKELSSYEDSNLLLQLTKQSSDSNHGSTKFVLKILSSTNEVADSFPKKIECVKCLISNDFSCSNFLPGLDGNYVQIFSDNGPFRNRSALLYSYIEGNELENTGYAHYLPVVSELGSFLAHFHRCLKGIPLHQDLMPDLEDPWSLSNYKLLLGDNYIEVIQEPSKKTILSETLDYVTKTLSASEDLLNKDILHGDFHGLNIIVRETYNPTNKWKQSLFKHCTEKQNSLHCCKQPESSSHSFSRNSAFESLKCTVDNVQNNESEIQNYCKDLLRTYSIIDFEAISYSYTILELGRLIADVMVVYIVQCSKKLGDDGLMESDSKKDDVNRGSFSITNARTDLPFSKDHLLKLGGNVMAGYLLVNKLPLVDLKCVYPAMLVSLCQYYILGTTSALDPSLSKEYVSYCSQEAFILLEYFHQLDADEVLCQWVSIAGDMLRILFNPS